MTDNAYHNLAKLHLYRGTPFSTRKLKPIKHLITFGNMSLCKVVKLRNQYPHFKNSVTKKLLSMGFSICVFVADRDTLEYKDSSILVLKGSRVLVDVGIKKLKNDLMVYQVYYNGLFIGSVQDAWVLYHDHGISHYEVYNNILIGNNPKTGMWYGFSVRMTKGFAMGSSVQYGDIGYVPVNSSDMRLMIENDLAKKYPKSIIEARSDMTYEYYCNFIEKRVYYDNAPYGKNQMGCVLKITEGATSHFQFFPYPPHWGLGVWTARTLDDVKRMASDFSIASMARSY